MKLRNSRILLSQAYTIQLGEKAVFFNCDQLIWTMSGFKATGANLVISSESKTRIRLMNWIAKMAWPSGWLLWPDQQIKVQQEELKQFGFRAAQHLTQMSTDTRNIPPEILYPENPIHQSLRIAKSSDVKRLAKHYMLSHNIPLDYSHQIASAHLRSANKNICTTWIAMDGQNILSAITTYIFGSTALISWLATCPEARQQGIGSAVLLTALNNIRDRGVESIELQAVPEASQMYQKMGFTKEHSIELWIHSGIK